MKELITKANHLLMQKAEYCLGVSEKSKHHGLQRDAYTHFTSPIRRYADLLVHRMLHNILFESDTSLFKIDASLVLWLNKVHSKFNKCERISHQLDRIYRLYDRFKDVFELDGYIVNLSDRKIKVYVSEFDITINCSLYSEKLVDLVGVKKEVDEKELETLIIYRPKKSEIRLKIFQKVKLKIAVVLSEKEKILSTVIEPNISALFDDFEVPFCLSDSDES